MAKEQKILWTAEDEANFQSAKSRKKTALQQASPSTKAKTKAAPQSHKEMQNLFWVLFFGAIALGYIVLLSGCGDEKEANDPDLFDEPRTECTVLEFKHHIGTTNIRRTEQGTYIENLQPYDTVTLMTEFGKMVVEYDYFGPYTSVGTKINMLKADISRLHAIGYDTTNGKHIIKLN